MKISFEAVIEIVRNTRKISFPYFGNIDAKEKTVLEIKEIVTDIDREIETFLRTELHKVSPEIGFVGEEFGGDRNAKKFWLVDPLDATGCYVRGIPFCTTMVALIDSGEVVFSIIYDFVNDIIYSAEKNIGAFRNGEQIHVSDRSFPNAYICCEINLKKEENKEVLSKIRSKGNVLHTLSAGYEFVLVATGKIEGRIVYDGFGKDYDFAAGSLLVSEAGGIVKNFNSNKYDYKNLNFIAANKNIYDVLVDENGIANIVKNN